eukprot:TRINITY_DN7072_c0_g1_i12.p1 TRINITY_DN7072_c0_g1~~TRINITY_DN7072_c0_g1_i12.p1  ORF type:complete len:961 (-),score=135.24 TRINITY_DN7072_c0_g1_i12:118-2961(-)
MLLVCVLLVLSIASERTRGQELYEDGVCGQSRKCAQTEAFIAGGNRVPCATEAPWNVFLEIRKSRNSESGSSPLVDVSCGGTLVTRKHVLTAAHCVWNQDTAIKNCPSCERIKAEDIRVFVGLATRHRHSSNAISVETIHIHPNFTMKESVYNGFDVAVLTLTIVLRMTDEIKYACLPTFNDEKLYEDGAKVKLYGFGQTETSEGSKEPTAELQKVDMKIREQISCRDENWNLTYPVLCAVGGEDENVRAKGPCNGDSGGGLVALHEGNPKYTVVGVVSFGASDCGIDLRKPSIFASVLQHIDWIRQTVGVCHSQRTQYSQSCQLPFKHKGKTFHCCTTEDSKKSWCALKTISAVDIRVNRTDENAWDFCLDYNLPMWGAWGGWGDCCYGRDKKGTRRRSRVCLTGQNCRGKKAKQENCDARQPCPGVPGKDEILTTWTPWGECECIEGKPLRTRTKICLHEENCPFDKKIAGVEQTICEKDCPIAVPRRIPFITTFNGGNEWGEWSVCAPKCIPQGFRTRVKRCADIEGCSTPKSQWKFCSADSPECPHSSEPSQPAQTPASTPRPTVNDIPAPDGKKIMCYYPNWAFYRAGSAQHNISMIDPTICTHFLYAFASLDFERLTIKSSDTNRDFKNKGFEDFVSLKKDYPAKKFMISMGGWVDSRGTNKYSRLMKSKKNRAFFVNNVVQFLTKYGFDGLDIDYEPNTSKEQAEDSDTFIELIKELRPVFSSRGWALTATTASKTSSYSAYNAPILSEYLDAIIMKTYNMHGASKYGAGFQTTKLKHHALLRSSDEEDLTIENAVNHWLSKGVDKNKLIVAIPAFGRTFTLHNNNKTGFGDRADTEGVKGPILEETGFLSYQEICLYFSEGGWTLKRDEYSGAPYAFKGTQWVGYDDPISAKMKAKYVLKRKLGGVIFWELTLDDFNNVCGGGNYPLISSVNEVLYPNA